MKIIISREIWVFGLCIVSILAFYFLGFYLQKRISGIAKWLSKKVGTYTVKQEYSLQRYIFQHRSSIVARVYSWVNMQIIALGLKAQGVTPFGFMLFWAFVAFIMTSALALLTRSNVFVSVMFWAILYVCLLIVNRVVVSGRMERRETEVMDAIDLIIPEIRSGVKNSILRYQDNFSMSLRPEFKSFVSNIQDRGFYFNDAMYILSDNLGPVFNDFAQKAIFYEASGEEDMVDIFSDIIETNRIRRELRDKNTTMFNSLKVSFVVSSFITGMYFVFLMVTDSFSRSFFLRSAAGNALLVAMVLVVFGVMSFITTIKSRAI